MVDKAFRNRASWRFPLEAVIRFWQYIGCAMGCDELATVIGHGCPVAKRQPFFYGKYPIIGVAVLLVSCTTPPQKIFSEVKERDIMDAKDSLIALERISGVIERHPEHFYGYALLGAVYQYMSRFDSASLYFALADSIFSATSLELDAHGRLAWWNDGSVWLYQDMVVRRMENDILLGKRESAASMLENFERNFFLKREDGSAFMLPENRVEFGLKSLLISPCAEFDSSMKEALQNFENLKALRQKNNISWTNHDDIKAYVELFESTGDRRFLDSAHAMIGRRDSGDRMLKYLRARIIANSGNMDSADSILGSEPSLYALFLNGRLRSLTNGNGFYGMKPCKK